MFAYIPVELKAPGATGDSQIRSVFHVLGYDIRPDEARLDASGQGIRVSDPGGERNLKLDSNEYHRHLGVKNLTTAAPEKIFKEIDKYGVFTGASGSFQANLYVSRTTSGSIAIWCYQENLERLLPFCEKIGGQLCSGPLNDLVDIRDLKSENQNFILYSSSGGVVCYGDIQFGRLKAMLKQRSTDIGLLLLTFSLLMTCVVLKLIPWSSKNEAGKTVKIDPLLPTIRAFVENVWPPSIVALATLMLSLLIALIAIPRQQVCWSWKK